MNLRFAFFLVAISLMMGKAHDLVAQPIEIAFEDVDSLTAQEERLIVVFFHADWCKFCRQMQHTILVSSSIVNTLNSDFYYISFDVESCNDVNYKGRTFSYIPTGPTTGIHELALELSTYSGGLELPFLCVFNSQNDVIFHHSGLLRNEELLEVLSRLKDL